MELIDIKPVEPDTVKASCKNCSAPLYGNYCSDCGQKVITKRTTVRSIFQELFSIFTNLEKGFWYTLKTLFVNPGEVVRHYINGQTVRYYAPFRYLLLWIAISVAFSLANGLYDQQQAVVQEITTYSKKPEVADLQRKMQQQVQSEMRKYLNFVPLLFLPFMGLASFLAFRKRGQNFGEHLVLNAYAYGQTTAMGVVVMLLMVAFPKLLPFFTIKVLVLSVAYYAYLYRSFYNLRTLQAIFKALFTTLFGYLMGIIFFGILGIVIGIFLYAKMKGG